MLLPLAAVVCCMALVLAGMVSSCRAEKTQEPECFERDVSSRLLLLNEQENQSKHGVLRKDVADHRKIRTESGTGCGSFRTVSTAVLLISSMQC